MRLAFMGTPAFSVPVLGELVANGHEVVCVYTQPPRRAGRGKKQRNTPVHDQAAALGLTVRTPLNFKDHADRDAFAALDLDVAIVVAYGLILPKAILGAPRFGCLNLHASLLPRWRGAAPIHRAIMAGDRETGVQVMQMEVGLDTGPILLSETTAITDSDTMGTLEGRLSHIGAQLAPRALAALARGSLNATPQLADGVCYAHKIDAAEAQIDWDQPVRHVDCHIRGLSPNPGAWFMLAQSAGKDLRIKCLFSAVVPGGAAFGPPGAIKADGDKLIVQCRDGVIALERLQRPGRAQQQAAEFLRGLIIAEGTVLQSASISPA
ncbi:MAG: methionyl-tRNA formyltransferase [Pseudomonadota bacterium]